MRLIDIENIDYVRLEDSLHCLEHHKGDEVECVICAPTVEAYTKDGVIEMLTELKNLIDKLPNKRHYITENGVTYGYKDYEPSAKDASQLVQAKINQLRSEGKDAD